MRRQLSKRYDRWDSGSRHFNRGQDQTQTEKAKDPDADTGKPKEVTDRESQGTLEASDSYRRQYESRSDWAKGTRRFEAPKSMWSWPESQTEWGKTFRPRHAYAGYRRYRTRPPLLEVLWNTKIFRQVVICLAIYGLVLAAIQGPSPVSIPVTRLLGRVISEEYDFVAAMKNVPAMDYIKEKTLIPLPFLFKEEVKNSGTPEVMIWPLEGTIISNFGWRRDTNTGNDEFHQGIDIEAPLGTPVLAAMDGCVSSVTESITYGNVIILDHGDGLETVYAHCSEILVKAPALVKQTDVIARVGLTGNTRTPHLHFEVRRDGTPVDPGTFLVPSGTTTKTQEQGVSAPGEAAMRASNERLNNGDAL